MMASPTFHISIVFLVLLLSINVQAICDNTGGWAKPVYEFMESHLSLLSKAHDLTEEPLKNEKIEDFVQGLMDFQGKAKKFMAAPLSNPEVLNDCFSMIVNLPYKRWGALFDLINSNMLPDNDEYRGSEINSRLRQKVKEYSEPGDNAKAYTLPMEEMCQGIPASILKKEISITDLCPNVDSCATEEKPYGVSAGLGQYFTDACTVDKKCDLSKAVPMMAGVFWYEINEWIVERMCPGTCAGGDCKFEETYNKLIHEANLLMAFASITSSYFTSTWKTFFEDAVVNNAYLNLDQSLAMVQEKEKVLVHMPTACNDLLFNAACPHSDIHKEFVMIKKIQKYTQDKTSLSFVRDLRNLPNIDFKTRLEQEKITLQHIELLGSIKALDENLEASVSGISQYFQGLATYDEGIADADMQFIQGELDKYEASLTQLEAQIKDEVSTIMKKMVVVVAANVGEAAALLAAKIAENTNPLKIIFSGPDLADTIEATGKVANAASELARGSALLVALTGLADDSLKIAEAFLGNKGQITGLKEIVDKIRQNKADDIGKDADTFLAAYSDYTPQTDRSKLEKNNALWSAFKDATCDLLSGEVGIGGAVAKGIVGGQLLCERLEGTLAQFFTIRGDIFDFQFELVDSVAAIVRGNIAKRFSENIKGKGDVLHASQLLIGSFKMHNRFQTTASMYCDVLTYQSFGEELHECSTINGLYSKENLNALIVHSFTADVIQREEDVYIPTRASFCGDTGYIDLTALSRGETVVFKLPANRDWLLSNGWMFHGSNKIPFLKDLKIFLPQKEYKTGADKTETTTTVTATSVASTYISLEPSKKNIAFVLPRRHGRFQTVYEEGYDTCSGTLSKEIDNPYSLCQNLPKICVKSSSIAGSLSLYPTALSTFSLSYTITQKFNVNVLKWSAPAPATQLLIKAKATFLVPRASRKRSLLPQLMTRSEVVPTQNGCCEGNTVRVNLVQKRCKACPSKSTSNLRGYYCEIDEEEEEEEEEGAEEA